jgi:hypothetical protein
MSTPTSTTTLNGAAPTGAAPNGAALNGSARPDGKARHSAYPPAVVDLLPRARKLAAELGELPSQNQLKARLRIGRDKARAVRAALDSGGSGQPAGAAEVSAPAADDASATASGDASGAAGLDGSGGHGDPWSPAAVRAALAPEEARIAAGRAAGAAGTGAGERRQGRAARRVRSWPVLLLALPAAVAIWSGWVGLGKLAGFGVMHPLPGIADEFAIDSTITLPVGMEAYAAYALRVWLSPGVPERARRFARWSAITALFVGWAGQGAYHLLAAAGATSAPWPVTLLVASLPVAVLGMGAALAHLITNHDNSNENH